MSTGCAAVCRVEGSVARSLPAVALSLPGDLGGGPAISKGTRVAVKDSVIGEGTLSGALSVRAEDSLEPAADDDPTGGGGLRGGTLV